MPLTDEELKAIVVSERDTASSFNSSELSEQRADAMKRYLAEPYGDEREGRSKVVLTDVADTIEWILPSLLRIFTASNDTVQFDPVEEGDIEQAEQETDYVNWVFNKDNSGFLILHTWFKDALLQKNGVVKHWWQETERVEQETYASLFDDQLVEIVTPDDVEVLEHSQRTEIVQDPVSGISAPVSIHDVKIKRKTKDGRVAIEGVPPEEFLISKRAKTIKDASFVCHRSRKTRSELIEMGFDRKKIMAAPQAGTVGEHENEEDARHENDDTRETDTRSDAPMQEVEFFECYIRVDRDGDNIAELLKVDMVGNTLLEWEEADSIPFSSITPVPMPHKWVGLSIADLVSDLQKIRTTVMRQTLDNMYLTNNTRTEIPEPAIGEHTLEDWYNNVPGGAVRTAVAGMMRSIDVEPMWQFGMQMLETLSRERETRTGVTRFSQGLDADALSQQRTAVEVNALTEGAQVRVELIARIFAETGVKDLFLAIHALVRKYQDVARIVRLRGKFVSVDPSGWRERMDLTTNVGLGTGNKDQQASLTAAIMDRQLSLREAGLNELAPVSAIAETLRRFVEATGQKAVDKLVPDLSLDTREFTRGEIEALVEQTRQQAILEFQQSGQALVEGQIAVDQNKEQARTQGKLVEIDAKLRADLTKQQAQHEDNVERDELGQDHALEQIGAEAALEQNAPAGQ